MAIAFSRVPWAAPFVLVAVLMMVLAPETADAHGGQDHQAPSGATGASPPAPGLGTAYFPASGLSPICPSGPGHPCGCGNPFALARADKTFAFDYGGWNLPVPRPVARIKPPPFRIAPPSAPLLSPASPRAPPLYS